MIQGETAAEYNWYDIQMKICAKMGITEHQFRGYHMVVGGDHKDLWHVALDSVISDEMQNDTVIDLFSLEDYEGCKGKYLNAHGSWTEPFFDAYNAVMRELDPGCDGVKVEFSW